MQNAHEAGTVITKRAEPGTAHPDQTFYRFPCSCGWNGCFWPSEAKAGQSFAKHVERAK